MNSFTYDEISFVRFMGKSPRVYFLTADCKCFTPTSSLFFFFFPGVCSAAVPAVGREDKILHRCFITHCVYSSIISTTHLKAQFTTPSSDLNVSVASDESKALHVYLQNAFTSQYKGGTLPSLQHRTCLHFSQSGSATNGQRQKAYDSRPLSDYRD